MREREAWERRERERGRGQCEIIVDVEGLGDGRFRRKGWHQVE